MVFRSGFRSRRLRSGAVWGGLAAGLLWLAGCRTVPAPGPAVPAGDEIVVAGRRFHTGARVVAWTESGGYDAYRAERNRTPQPEAIPAAQRAAAKNFGSRRTAAGRPVPPGDLPALRRTVDQFVLHYDGSGLSRTCFDVLCRRQLSTHFLLDVDGTIYQTLDLQERAFHATSANDRSIGIEIANLGAYPPNDTGLLTEWYRRDADGALRLRPPPRIADPGIRTPGFIARPARPTALRGAIQGRELVQYDLTPEQYAALAKLTAALCRVFPLIRCDYPRDGTGRLVRGKLPDDALARYRGILGHYHIQENKVDPGPAFQWDELIAGARREMQARP